MSPYVKHRPGWQTVVCVATGPSLTMEQAEQLKAPRAAGRIKVLGVNCAYQRVECDALLAVDLMWFKKYHADVKRRYPNLETITQDASAHKQYGVTTRIRGSARDGLGLHEISTGGNSGHAAVSAAFLFGARRIALIGYDFQLGPNGEKHFHPDHPSPCIQTQLFEAWRRRFESTARDLAKFGIDVRNCSERTALKCFPLQPLEETLREWGA